MRRVLAGLGVLVLAVGGYLTADVYDLVPGVLTLARTPATAGMPALPAVTPGASPSVTVTRAPIPSAAASAAAPLVAAAGTAPLPTTAGLTAALAAALADPGLGSSVGLTVRDVSTGAHLLDVGADAPRTPASSLKLLTAAAVDATFPPGTRLTTQVVQGPAPDQVVLVAGGDTLLNPGPGDPGAVPGRAGLGGLVAATAASLRSRGVTRVSVSPDLSHAPGPLVAPTWSSSFRPAGITGAVAVQYIAMAEEERGVVRGTLTTAVPIQDADKQAIMDKLGSVTGKSVLLESEVDPSVLGGVRVRIQDVLFDHTLRHRLDQLRAELGQVRVI